MRSLITHSVVAAALTIAIPATVHAQDYVALCKNGCTITDMKHKLAIVAGDVADNRVYHQKPEGRSNARWRFVFLGEGTYNICDVKHGLCLVTGDAGNDGNVYHQKPAGRMNAMWTMTKGENNWNCVYLTDNKNKTRIQGGWVGESRGFAGAPAGADGSIYAIVPKQYAIPGGFMKPAAVGVAGGSCWTIAS